MPTLRSREMIFKTLEVESSLNPSTPSKSDAISAPTPSPSPGGSARAPRRRSLRLAAISGGKREPRVSPNEGEIRASEENGAMNLGAGASVAKRKAMVEIRVSDDDCFEEGRGDEVVRVLKENGSMNLRSGSRIGKREESAENEKGFESGLCQVVKSEEVVEEEIVGLNGKRKSVMDDDDREEIVEGKLVVEGCSLMNLRSSSKILKREGKMEDVKDFEFGVDERLDFADGFQIEKCEHTVGPTGKRRLVLDDDCVKKVKDEMVIDIEDNGKGKSVVEDCSLMNLRSGTRLLKREGKVENGKDLEPGVDERLDFEGIVVEEKPQIVVEEKPQIVENSEVMQSSKGKNILEEEIVSLEGLSYDAKGKGKLVLGAECIENVEDDMVIDKEDNEKGKLVVEKHHSLINNDEVLPEGSSRHRRGRKARTRMATEFRKEAERNKAIELAPKYAFFKAEEEGSEEEVQEEQEEHKKEDWPGPFSTAMKIIQDREQMLISRELNPSSKKVDDTEVKIQWIPSNHCKSKPTGKMIPSLFDLCMKVLCENAEEIESLDGVPDVIKHRLVSHLCRMRKMGSRVFGLLAGGSPTEIYMSDCSWATEGELEGAFGRCNTQNLKVVELNLSGRCLPDYVLQGILARSPNCLPLLTKISLKGNYRLSDDGLNAIVASAPLLSSVNLSQCSFITSSGIIYLAHKLESVLRELYIDDCQDIDAMLILPALLELKHVEVLSVAGIETVTDKFVKKLVSVCGPAMKGLILAGCRKLTAASMKAIGESCSQLCSLDLRNLTRLNDSAIGHLANGCRSIQKLKLRRNAFSDEAVAAFVEASGGSLNELSVNNVEKVGQQTAIAISRQCASNLWTLDLSFCRNMTNEALGLIVDSCSNLRILKLFGCTQINNVFLEGHSNSVVKIVGSMGSVLDQIEARVFL